MQGCVNQSREQKITLTISAATSLKEPLAELAESYHKEHPSITLTFNMGSSGSLMNQIKQGAPVDIFFSAANQYIDDLEKENLIDQDAKKQLLTNDLVLVAPVGSRLTSFADLTGDTVKRIAIGEPDSVPAGSYAKATLTSMNMYQSLSPKFVLAKDVRQVLTYTVTGNVDAGFVYATDVIKAQDIIVIATAPANSHPSIIYPVAVIKTSKYPKETKQLWDFLLSDQAAKVFLKYGFRIYQP
jgi:molybdate transport system substrate-binding protein